MKSTPPIHPSRRPLDMENMNVPQTLLTRRQALALSAAAALASVSGGAFADQFPSRPLRLVIPFAPGGASDAIARVISEYLPRQIGQPVMVDNKPGGSTIIGVDAVAKAPADGHTLLLAGVGSYSVLPAVRKTLPFNVEKDLAMIALVCFSPNILVTSADKPFKTLGEFIQAAKAKPGSLRYATYGDGSANHLVGVMFENAAGIRLEPIAYKGAADAKLALLRGDIDLSFETMGSAGAEMKSGRLRALANGGPTRSKLLPDLPSFTELGLGQAASQPMFGVSVPAATPAAVRARLTKEIMEVMNLPAAREKALAVYLEPVAMGADEMKETIARESANYRRVAQQLKLQLD